MENCTDGVTFSLGEGQLLETLSPQKLLPLPDAWHGLSAQTRDEKWLFLTEEALRGYLAKNYLLTHQTGVHERRRGQSFVGH